MGNAITCESQVWEKSKDGTWKRTSSKVNGSNSKARKERHYDLYPKGLQQKKSSAFLEEPVTVKSTERGEATLSVIGETSRVNDGSNKLRYAVSEMQGWRSHMEDEYLLNPALSTSSKQEQLLKDHHLFAVFDGHSGGFSSAFCGEYFVPTLISQKGWKSYLKLPNDKGSARSSSRKRESVAGLSLLKSALTSTFLELDVKLMEAQRQRRLSQLSHVEDLVYSLSGSCEYDVFQRGSEDHKSILNFSKKQPASMPADIPLERSGSTGVVVLITPSHILCANAGDSRAILAKRSETSGQGEVLPLSFDHKPKNDVELCRIENDGGFVRTRRVDGDLAVSRGFGDFEYKNCGREAIVVNGGDPSSSGDASKDHRVTVHPDIIVHAREPRSDEFVVLACDGIWDRLTSRDCADLVRELAYEEGETDVGLVCEEVVDATLELDSHDNMTCCAVFFPGHGRKGQPNVDGGVLKRRNEREKAWGEDSTPAKRAQLRLEKWRRECQDASRGGPMTGSSSHGGRKDEAPDSVPRVLKNIRRR